MSELHGIYEVSIGIRLNADMSPNEFREMMEDAEFTPGTKAGIMIEQLEVLNVRGDL